MIRKYSKFLLVFVLITSWIYSGWPQIWHSPDFPPQAITVYASVTETFTSDGTFSPADGVTSADVACWGGGGGGEDGVNKEGSGGGGAGGFASSTVSVSFPTGYAIVVGQGGPTDTDGSDTTFAGTTVIADSGKAGGGVTAEIGGLGGTANTGDVSANGGAGGDGNTTGDLGGGGGGAGGPHGAGAAGANGAAGVGGNGGQGDNGQGGAGGAGGNGGGPSAPGSPGTSSTLGGGGGGGGDNGGNGGAGATYGAGGGGGETGGGAGANGACEVTYLVSIDIADADTNGSTVTVAPESGRVETGRFKTKIISGTGNISSLTITFPTSVVAGIASVNVWDSGDSTEYLSATSPTGDTFVLTTGTNIPVTSSFVEFRIWITPKTHGNMAAPSGAEYAATTDTTAYSCDADVCTADTDSADQTVTIDNLSPNSATSQSGVAGDNKVTLAWTTSNSSDFSTTTIFRWVGASVGSDNPVEGTDYNVGDTIGSATVACAILDSPSTGKSGIVDGAGGSAGCNTSSLSADTYSYTIFSQDSNGNHDSQAGVNVENMVVTSGNSLPVASGVMIDGGVSPVVLNEGTTKTVSCTGTVTDSPDFNDIQSVKADLFRTDLGIGSGLDDNGHYQLEGDANCVPSEGSGSTETYTCDFSVQYFADPTDAGSPNAGTDWTCTMTPTDSVGEGTADSNTFETASLIALSVTSSIAYGTVDPNTDTGATNQQITVTNTGNRDMDPQLSSAGAMTCGGDSIAVGQQEYFATSFTYGSGTDLSGTPTTLDITLPQRTSGVITDTIEWGLGVPDGTENCAPYTGTNDIAAVAGI